MKKKFFTPKVVAASVASATAIGASVIGIETYLAQNERAPAASVSTGVQSVPEPSALILAALGILIAVLVPRMRRWRKRERMRSSLSS